MALPKLNVTPSYEMEIPSTGQKVKYRPYLVKEEKILLLAFESGDVKQSLSAVANTLKECLETEVNVDALTTFDIEYMFLKVRGKSVGETTDIIMACKECSADNTVSVNVDNIEIEWPEEASNNMVQLTNDIAIELRHPSYADLVDNISVDQDDFKLDGAAINSCIVAIHTPDERIDPKDSTPQELEEFMDTMTVQQVQKIRSFLEHVPTAKLDSEFVCTKCGATNTNKITGVQNFFS